MSDSLRVDFAIIGAGVTGLALARAVTEKHPSATTVVLDRHKKFGQETSSRNSEVIHAGIYYSNTPAKARHCVRGRELLYDFCEKYEVPFDHCGKYVVATQASQVPALDAIEAAAQAAGAPLERVAASKAAQRSGVAGAVEALWSPSTGIVDSHSFMARLEQLAHAQGAIFLYGHTVSRVAPGRGSAVEIEARDPAGDPVRIEATCLLNAAGLASARVASWLDPAPQWTIRPCRGRYYGLSSRWNGKFKHLVYPVPDPRGGLGVHVTFDLSGKCRLGPDVDWSRAETAEPDSPELWTFDASSELAHRFLESGRALIPSLEPEDLSPDYVGVRPKLFAAGRAHPDFLIARSSTANAWHFLGVESPGLTAALSLATAI